MTQSSTAQRQYLDVPGASLYYEVRGSGPTLLMIPGGPATSDAFSRIAGLLEARYTVVTYDPRGLSRSKLTGPLDDTRTVQIFADDASRLLRATSDGPAHVFGSSGGAVIALDLALRYPQQLRIVVAHEPPSPTLLPNSAEKCAEMEDIVETYRTAGLGPTMQKFMVHTRIRSGPPPAPAGEPTPEMREGMAQMQRNMDFWFRHYFLAIAHYTPDIAQLKAGPVRIVPGVGEESRGELANEGGLGLASQLGTQAVTFPGAHGGFESDARQFADRLINVLSA